MNNLQTKIQKYDWSLFERNSVDLREGLKKESSVTNFGDFKPQISYNTYSRQEQNTVIFIEQKPSGAKDRMRFIPKILAYNITDPAKGLKSELNDPLFRAIDSTSRKIVPKSLNEVSAVFKIKGLFGILALDSNGSKKNSTIILIEYCPTLGKMGGDDNVCEVPISINYCIAEESDENPIDGSSVNSLFI